ncbi:tetratricopeptide repeat protein 27-like [Antedon mediterranea]|uniref:tetratricopeptide repeat protein 27-like n=1 Tax=Antedon mediterranea TaxID=105859 RepID=UPI003AF7E469
MALPSDYNLLVDTEKCLLLESNVISKNVSKQLDDKTSAAAAWTEPEGDKCVQLVLNRKYESCLLCGTSVDILGTNTQEEGMEDLGNAIENRIKKYLNDEQVNCIERELEVLCIGISLLNLFVQNNWTGPKTKCQPTHFLSQGLRTTEKAQDFKEFCKESLSSSSDAVYSLLDFPEYLFLAKVILVQCRPLLTMCQTSDWWAMRCLWIQQQLIDEKSPEIHEEIMKCREKILKNEVLVANEDNMELCVMFHLECCPLSHYYYHYQQSEDHLEAAQKAAGIKVSFTGALGKRTKFQQTNCAQLILKIEKQEIATLSTALSEDDKSLIKENLPKDLHLDDDVILERVQLLEPNETKSTDLAPLQQAVVLGLFSHHKRNSAKFELLKEELNAYVDNVLGQPQCWGAQIKALMARSLLEKDKGRKIERAMMQVEVLVNELKQEKCPVSVRFHHFYSLNLPPKWVVESEQASLLLSLGSTSAALQVYLRLQLWEEAIFCYQKLDKLDKAERLIHDQLSAKETPLMLCLLGDVTRNPEHYLKAWEVSNHKSARAQRSLGRLYLDDEKYEESIQCFEKSLERNSLQYNTWFLLGFAALKSEQYKVAIRAYRKCLTIEMDNFESWNNLAHCHIKLKEKGKAHKTLQEAIKCNYENEKVWENFLFVATDVGDFQSSIQACHRLLDLKGKYVDEEIMNILVTAVVNNITGSDGVPASKHRKKLQELFGRLTSIVTGNADVWRSYARLLGDGHSSDQIDNDKAIQCLQKSHRCRTQNSDWSKDVETCMVIMEQSIELSKAYQLVSESKTSHREAIQLLSSAKLMLKTVHSNTKLQHGEFENEGTTKMAGLQLQLEQELQNVLTLINKRKEQDV